MPRCQLQHPVVCFLEAFCVIGERQNLAAQFPSTGIDCPGKMFLAAYVASYNKHVLADKRKLLILAELPVRLQIVPGTGL